MNFRRRIAIDLGTTSILVYTRKSGVIIKEPSVVAIDRFTKEVISVGDDAKEILGKTPGHIVAERPLKDGVIVDYNSTEAMLRYFLKKSVGKMLIKPDVIICVPSGATQVQKRAVKQAGIKAGANEVYLIEEPLAAAIGSEIEIGDSKGNMIIDIGGGTTDVAVISKGGIVVSESIKVAGDACDQAIIDYIRRSRNVIIGENSAENLKIMYSESKDKTGTFPVNGRNLFNGLPNQVILSREDIENALRGPIEEIVKSVQSVMAKTPPELISDLYERGAVLAGGGSLIGGIREAIEDKIKIDVKVSENPVTAVVRGTGKSLNWINKLDPIENSKIEMTRRLISNQEKLRRR